MSVDPGPDAVAGARRAVAERRWDEAAAAFAAADTAASLAPDDLRGWATASYLLGRADDALGALTRAYQQHVARAELDDAARCGFWIVYALVNRGEIGQAGGWLTRVGRLLGERASDGPGAGYLLAFDAFRAAAIDHDYARAHTSGDQAAQIGREHGEADLVALALNAAGRALISSGEIGQGLDRLDEAMVGVVADEVSPIVAGAVYCSVIEACADVLEFGRAAEWTDALARWCDEQHGMLTFTGQCLTHRATVLRLGGQLHAAADEAARACRRFVGTAEEPAAGRAIYELAEVQRLTGDLSKADASYHRAAEFGHDPLPGLALLRLAQGRSGAAIAMMRRRMEETTGQLERLRQLPAYVEVLLDVADIGAATAAAHELTTTAAAVGTTAAEAEAAYATGNVALARGEPAEALMALREALQRWRSLRAPREAARCRVLIARACSILGDDDAASVELEAARRALTEMGARGDLSRLRAQTSAGGPGLTAREAEVLALVASGKTNRMIADELALAVRTVDRHVANILAKLGVTSRTAATAVAYEKGLL